MMQSDDWIVPARDGDYAVILASVFHLDLFKLLTFLDSAAHTRIFRQSARDVASKKDKVEGKISLSASVQKAHLVHAMYLYMYVVQVHDVVLVEKWFCAALA
jgi:hypothetical protein